MKAFQLLSKDSSSDKQQGSEDSSSDKQQGSEDPSSDKQQGSENPFSDKREVQFHDFLLMMQHYRPRMRK